MSSRHLQSLRITPQGSSAFEHVVRRLGLSPSQYATSAELKEWVRKHKDSRYVPPHLLKLWSLEVDVKLFDELMKPPKRAA